MRGEIIWDKSASAGSSCAWGSFKSASNPCLRDIHEYILVFSKGDYKLPRSKSEKKIELIQLKIKNLLNSQNQFGAFYSFCKRIGHRLLSS